MSLIKIKQLEERIATSGLFMGSPADPDKFRRKLEPGEIVEIPDDMMIDDEKAIDFLFATGKIDMVPPSTPPTRPLDYDNRRDAKLCSPTFRPRDPTDERDMAKARAKYQARLDEQYNSMGIPKDEEPPGEEETHPQQPPPTSRRGMRRARAEAAKHGEAHPT